jgi:hypothetical protein
MSPYSNPSQSSDGRRRPGDDAGARRQRDERGEQAEDADHQVAGQLRPQVAVDLTRRARVGGERVVGRGRERDERADHLDGDGDDGDELRQRAEALRGDLDAGVEDLADAQGAQLQRVDGHGV